MTVDPKWHPQEIAYDLMVIGSGPAGIHAAVQAAKLNKRVCVLEKHPQRIGGAWLHTGTLPSKTLREVMAAIYALNSHLGASWVKAVVHNLDAAKLLNRARAVSEHEETLVRRYLHKNNIDLIHGQARFEEAHRLMIEPAGGRGRFSVSADHVLIATGSRPRRPESVPFDGFRVVDSDQLLQLPALPRKMCIFGAGVIACEYACIFAALGVEVTVMDSRPRILPYLDREIVAELQRSMESLGICFELGDPLGEVTLLPGGVELVAGRQRLRSDVLFFAAGRVPNTDRLGLEQLGIDCDNRGAICVNSHFQTNISSIYAAGDVIGAPALAATSSHQGRHVACHAFGEATEPFPHLFPIGVYTIPELSMVGQTEEQLRERGVEYVVGRASYREIARGVIRGDTHGLVKLLVDRNNHLILGVHIVGDDAANLIHIGLALMLQGTPVEALVNHVFNYPTLAEGLRIAAFNAINKLQSGRRDQGAGTPSSS